VCVCASDIARARFETENSVALTEPSRVVVEIVENAPKPPR